MTERLHFHTFHGFSSSHTYGCESWTIKKAEGPRIDAFELQCWRRLLRVPWTARRSNQSIQRKSVLNIHWKDWCWSWCFNTLATWCKELTYWKRSWCWESLKAGEEGDDRGWASWMVSVTWWTWVWASSRSWWWTGRPGVLQAMGLQRVGHDWATELNWTAPCPGLLLYGWGILKDLYIFKGLSKTKTREHILCAYKN